MKRIRRAPDEVSLSRFSLSGPVKFDHEIFVSAHAGDLQGVLRFFEPAPSVAPTSSPANADGNSSDHADSGQQQEWNNSNNLEASLDASSGLISPRPGTALSGKTSSSTPLPSKKHPSLDHTKFDTSNSDYIDRLLHCSAKFDWPELIGRHLAHAPGFRTSKVKSAFRRACAHGSLGVVKLMLDGDAELGVPKFCDLADAGTDGKTGLHIACHHGRPRIVEELLARAANKEKYRMEELLEKEDLSRTTPLLLAVAAGHIECIEPLLIAGAQVLTKSGKSSIDFAVSHNLPEVADLLRSFAESGKPPVTLPKLAHDQQWDKLTSWSKFACAERFTETFHNETAFYWSVLHGNADAAVDIGIHQGEAMKRTYSAPWEAEIVDFLISKAHRATTHPDHLINQQGFVVSAVITRILEALFTPLVEAESNLGMVDPEQQKEHWAELTKLVFPEKYLTEADQDNNNLSSVNQVDKPEATNPWPSICTLLGSITIGLPQMSYGFLRVLPSIIPNAASDEKFKKDFITLVINCISFDRQRSEARRFTDVLAMVDKMIERGDWELSRQTYQFLLQSAFILRLGWYPECLPLISKFADHIIHLWSLQLVADEKSKTSLLSFLLEFEGARNEKDKHLFDLLIETENSSEAVVALMKLGCSPSRKPDCIPDEAVAVLLKKARFFPQNQEELYQTSSSSSVADIARKQETNVLLNLLRRPGTSLTARDLGFIKSMGKTAYEWCLQESHKGQDGLIREIQFFLVPILTTAIQENDVATLSTLLHELSSVAFTMKLINGKNLLQLVLSPDYKFPPVRALVLQILESTQPEVFEELINMTTLTDVIRLEDSVIAKKYLDNSAHFAFDTCRVHMPLDSSEVSRHSRQRYFDQHEVNANVNGGFDLADAADLDSRQKSFSPGWVGDHAGFKMMDILMDSLKKNQKFTRNCLLSHPSISTWVQINWKQFKLNHNRFIFWSFLSLFLTCLYICCFSFWGTKPQKTALQSFWILLGMWVILVATNLPSIAWEVNQYSILGSRLYFYHAESYLKIGSIALPVLFGFPLSYLVLPIMSIQKGILAFAPIFGSLSLMASCGSRSPGKAIMLFVKTLDQFRKLYFYLIPALGIFVSFLALYGSWNSNFLHATMNATKSFGLFWLDDDIVDLTGPILVLAATFILKMLFFSILIGTAVKVTIKVDEEAETLWNQRKLTFMYQAIKEAHSLVHKAAKVVLIGKRPVGASLCLNHFVLGTESQLKEGSNDEVTTVYQFKKFVSKLKNNQGKDHQHQQLSEIANTLQRLDSHLNTGSEERSSPSQDLATLRSDFSKLLATLEELRSDVKNLKVEVMKNKSPERGSRMSVSRTDSFSSSAMRLFSPSK